MLPRSVVPRGVGPSSGTSRDGIGQGPGRQRSETLSKTAPFEVQDSNGADNANLDLADQGKLSFGSSAWSRRTGFMRVASADSRARRAGVSDTDQQR